MMTQPGNGHRDAHFPQVPQWPNLNNRVINLFDGFFRLIYWAASISAHDYKRCEVKKTTLGFLPGLNGRSRLVDLSHSNVGLVDWCSVKVLLACGCQCSMSSTDRLDSWNTYAEQHFTSLLIQLRIINRFYICWIKKVTRIKVYM